MNAFCEVSVLIKVANYFRPFKLFRIVLTYPHYYTKTDIFLYVFDYFSCQNNQNNAVSVFSGGGGGGGQGGLNLPLPVLFNPGSRPVFFGSLPFAFFRLRNIVQCCIIFPFFSRFPPPWESRFPPPLLLPPVHLPPPYLPVSRPPVSPPPHFSPVHTLQRFENDAFKNLSTLKTMCSHGFKAGTVFITVFRSFYVDCPRKRVKMCAFSNERWSII